MVLSERTVNYEFLYFFPPCEDVPLQSVVREEPNACSLLFAASFTLLHLVSSAANKLETWNITMMLFSAKVAPPLAIVIRLVPCNEVLSRRLSPPLICILRTAAWTGNRVEVCQTTAESSLIGNPCVQRAWQDNYLPPFVSHAALSRHICWFLLFLLLLCFNNKAIPANHCVFAYQRSCIS